MFKCEYCNYIATNSDNLNDHVRDFHIVQNNNMRKPLYICSLCGNTYKYPNGLRKHYIKEHCRQQYYTRQQQRSTVKGKSVTTSSNQKYKSPQQPSNGGIIPTLSSVLSVASQCLAAMGSPPQQPIQQLPQQPIQQLPQQQYIPTSSPQQQYIPTSLPQQQYTPIQSMRQRYTPIQQRRRQQYIPTPIVYNCMECGKQYRRKADLNNHIVTVHHGI